MIFTAKTQSFPAGSDDATAKRHLKLLLEDWTLACY